jgi:hypothetical protein
LVERQATPLGYYDDGLAWTYQAECARAVLADEPIACGFVASAVGRVYCQTLTTEAFFTPGQYRHGFTLYPRGAEFAVDTGRLVRHYDGKGMMCARGMQYAWIAAALLTDFEADPSAWETAMRQLVADNKLALLQDGASKIPVEFHTEPARIAAYLDRYIVGTIDFWAGVRQKLGYLPRGYFPDGRNATWVRMPELGAYAHLMKLVAFKLMATDGVTELELIRKQVPDEPLRHQPLPDTVLKIQGLQP